MSPSEAGATTAVVYTTARPVPTENQSRDMDLDYQAAMAAWGRLECGDLAALPVYRKNLNCVISQAIRYGRLDPRGRLSIHTAQGIQVIPISYLGFAWKSGDLSEVLLAANFNKQGDFSHHYYTPGIGISLVGVRVAVCDEMFFREKQSFPVTAVLRLSSGQPVLDFYNPLVYSAISVGPGALPLDRDLTASLAYLKEETPRRYLEAFLDPGESDVKPKLVMMEPCQRGKIPVVFIHGLGSDPLTWADATNRLRSQADIYRQFQFWYFRYPTGGDLLQSAAALREKLVIARETFDPLHQDPALEQMVLVGHSLGGLVAQLQVSHSYDLLWQKVARQPLEAVRASPETLEQLRTSFYFDPSPLVKRVVFMATPHHGSSMARRGIGRAAAKLVRFSGEEEAVYRQLMDANRDIFREYLWEKKPTAIDMLEPDNPLLDAMARMPISRCVCWHSIIGERIPSLDGDWTDGVVPVPSARLAGACSERYVSARHSKVNKIDESLDELQRILRLHAAAASASIGRQVTAD
jgi:pimeloyl-ACP methyl ester carboxylesterase